MTYILVSRNPRTGKLVIVTDGEDNVPAEFQDFEDAVDAAGDTTICKAWGYDVVEIEY